MNSLRKHLAWVCSIAAALVLAAAAPAMAGPGVTIVGSKHDFNTAPATFKGSTAATANYNSQICIYCHAPHNNKNTAGNLLWNHTASTAAYIPYTSPTMTGIPVGATTATYTVSPVSKVCLSCHDGTIAVDSYGANAGTVMLSGVALIGTDLSNDHPISFTYDTALATTDGALKNPSVDTVAIGNQAAATIDSKMLYSGKLECPSCHDVHNTAARTGETNKLLVMNNTGSALCLACHKK